MIGTALQPADMKLVVSKLETIEQPWNCPHGRPTMRHLIDAQKIREAAGTKDSVALQYAT